MTETVEGRQGSACEIWRLRLGLIVLGGAWVVLSRVISRVTILITHIRGLILISPTYNYP